MKKGQGFVVDAPAGPRMTTEMRSAEDGTERIQKGTTERRALCMTGENWPNTVPVSAKGWPCMAARMALWSIVPTIESEPERLNLMALVEGVKADGLVRVKAMLSRPLTE